MLVQQELSESIFQVGRRFALSKRFRPLLEGLLDGARHPQEVSDEAAITAVLLYNESKYLSSLDETTKTIAVGKFDKFSFPIIRAVYPNLIANDIVSVQPMLGPSALVFYMDYVFDSTKGGVTAGDSAFSSLTGPSGNEFYSSETVDNEAFPTASGDPSVSLAYTPVRPGTVQGSYTISGGATTVNFTDDGAGGLIADNADMTAGTVNYSTGDLTITSTAGVDAGSLTVTYQWDSEASDNVPMMNLSIMSAPLLAETRKLRARFSLEAAQDLQALHGLDADAELVGIMAEEVKQEIDQNIINDIYQNASAGSVFWDAAVPAGVSWEEHKLSLRSAFVKCSQQIYRSTKRGQANFMVVGLDVASVIETLPFFQADPAAFATQGNAGVIKIGRLDNRWDVYKSPYFPSNKWVMGYKGSSFLDAGYVYAPYVPIQATPTVVLDDFIGRRGLFTRFGRKIINGRFYATGEVTNL